MDVHIRRLREKIEKNPGEPVYIHTKWGVGYFFRISQKKFFRFIPMTYVVGIICMLMFNIFLSMATDHMVRSYEKKAVEEKASYVERQCTILANQLVLNGISAYSMGDTSDNRGANIYELEQLANDISGRI